MNALNERESLFVVTKTGNYDNKFSVATKSISDCGHVQTMFTPAVLHTGESGVYTACKSVYEWDQTT